MLSSIIDQFDALIHQLRTFHVTALSGKILVIFEELERRFCSVPSADAVDGEDIVDGVDVVDDVDVVDGVDVVGGVDFADGVDVADGANVVDGVEVISDVDVIGDVGAVDGADAVDSVEFVDWTADLVVVEIASSISVTDSSLAASSPSISIDLYIENDQLKLDGISVLNRFYVSVVGSSVVSGTSYATL